MEETTFHFQPHQLSAVIATGRPFLLLMVARALLKGGGRLWAEKAVGKWHIGENRPICKRNVAPPLRSIDPIGSLQGGLTL